MKKYLASLTLIVCGLVYSQMKINHPELQKIKTQVQDDFDKNLNKVKSYTGITPKMIENFVGYLGGVPVFIKESDTNQSIGTNTNWLYNEAIPGVNLSGLGMKVYIWDGGIVNQNHQEFGGRVIIEENYTEDDRNHPTNVAGVIMAAGLSTLENGNNSKGMAYNATLHSYDYGIATEELLNEAMSPENSDYLIANNSWGLVQGWDWNISQNIWYWYGNTQFSDVEPLGYGFYDKSDAILDELVYRSPQVIYVRSAGNDYGGGPGEIVPHYASTPNGFQLFENVYRPNNCGQTGFDCIPAGNIAKNIITVGAVNSMTSPYSGPSSVTIAAFSSVGPADDGRIKPDVVAVGTQVYTPTTGSNTAYTVTQGTSFSAPQASGNILLLQELFKQKYDEYLRADLTKAIVIHTANEAGSHPGPDYVFGWGLMDMKQAAELILGRDEHSLTDVKSIQNGLSSTIEVKAIDSQPLKVTISWLDPEGVQQEPVLNDRTPRLVNDLDLRVSDGLITYYPWKLDPNNPANAATRGDNIVDNSEQIIIDNPIPGHTYTITVSHKGNLKYDNQVYALVVSGVEVGCKAPIELSAYEISTKSAKIKWLSSQSSFDLELGEAGFMPSGNPTYSNISNNYLLEDLVENATYEYYVRAKCDENSISTWAGPYRFELDPSIQYDFEIGTYWRGEDINVTSDHPCAGKLTIEVPEGKKILKVDVEYEIEGVSSLGIIAGQFRSIVYSPILGLGENSFASVALQGDVHSEVHERELPFLVNATGYVDLELKVFGVNDVYFNNTCNETLGYVKEGSWKIKPVFVDVDVCLDPADISHTINTRTSFEVSWGGGNTDVVYGTPGFQIQEGNIIQNISGNSYVVANLQNEEVEYYVKSTCSEDWIGPFLVKFEDCSMGDGYVGWDYIENVSFANLDHTTTDHIAYNDFTNLSANVVQGETYGLSIKTSELWYDVESFRAYAYIDWNNNLTFETDELIILNIDESSSTASNLNVSVPEQAITGNTLMRVVYMYYDSFLDPNGAYQSCGSIDMGEVEDYTIHISSNEIIWTTEGAWSNVTGPTINDNAIIEGNLELNNDLSAKNLTIAEGGNLIVKTGKTLTLAGNLINESAAESVTIENDANLIQTNSSAENTGAIKVVRNSDDMVRLDYAMWSSPVTGQNILGFSPNTVPSRILSYEGTDYISVANPQSNEMAKAKGYMFRAPNTWWANGGPLPAQQYVGNFIGTPNNGNVNFPVYTNAFTSIGNPYPSNIDADEFLSLNTGISTLYFWTNRYGVDGNGNYSGSNYITFNSMGSSNGTLENGIITVGQGFIVKSTTASSVNFNNDLRTSNDGSFLKTSTTERHRFWLDFSEENKPAFNQILIGYMSGATHEVDAQIDGLTFGYEGPEMYSLIQDGDYAIQGRALPFESSDVVPLGFKANDNKKFTISLTDFDGLFADGNVNILLKDKELDIVHNLMENAYSFESAEGVHNERFEIIYQSEGEMGVSDLAQNNIQIYTHNKNVVIEAKNEKILSVELFDLQGKSLYNQSQINATKYEISGAVYKAQVIVVKVETAKGEIVSKKIIIK